MPRKPLTVTPMGFIAVSGFEQARTFYHGLLGDVLGLEYVSEDGFALVLRSGPIVIRFTVPPERPTANYTVFGWQVSDIAAAVAALSAKGVTFERYDFFGDSQSPEGIWTAPGDSKVAWFRDPDGNLLSLSQHSA